MNPLLTLRQRLRSKTPVLTTIYDQDLCIPHREGAVIVMVAHHVRTWCEPTVAEWAASEYLDGLMIGMQGVSQTQRRWLAFVQIAEESYPTLFHDAHAAMRRAMTLIGAPDAEISVACFREDQQHRDIRSAFPTTERTQLLDWTLSELLAGLHLDATGRLWLSSVVGDADDLELPLDQRAERRRHFLLEHLWSPPVPVEDDSVDDDDPEAEWDDDSD